ncbi:MAG TPA: DUF5985 family protein [Chloroflexota bacterium]|nr:DUF5985 family protein [Chloroflexota bacterium]
MNQFLLGAIAALSIVAGVVFVRSWRQTRDRLFLFFGLAFLIEGVNRAALALTSDPQEGDPFFFVVRAGAFSLILYAIWDKNRATDSA